MSGIWHGSALEKRCRIDRRAIVGIRHDYADARFLTSGLP